VLEGTIGVRIGDEIAEAGPGTYVFKPRNVKRTFWNPTDKPARFIELLVPAGFDDYFMELGRFFGSGGVRRHQLLQLVVVLEDQLKEGLLLGRPRAGAVQIASAVVYMVIVA